MTEITLPYIRESKICVIYAYYERKNEQKNQTNLSFFLRHAVDTRKWIHMNITYVFVINGHQCEVIIPNRHDINVLKEDNCSDWEGWYNGIRYVENHHNKPLWQTFDYVFLINAGSIGPYLPSNGSTNLVANQPRGKTSDNPNHWLLPFYEKMVKDNAVVCSPCITFLPETDAGGPGPRVVPICSLIRMDKDIYDLLMVKKISNYHRIDYPNASISYNTVLGSKKDKIDAILTGEYGLSRILLQNGYNITCLLYDDIDYNDVKNHNMNNYKAPDRYASFYGSNVPIEKTIFCKNIWRWENTRVCLPVNYTECISLMNKYLNMEPIAYSDLDFDSEDKRHFYQLHGHAEELIVLPVARMNSERESKQNKAAAIMFHYDADNIIKDYVIQEIKCLIATGYDIYFYTTSDKIQNVDLGPAINIVYLKNLGAGCEWSYLCDILKSNNASFKSKYEWILFINDSILFPINGLKSFRNTVDDMRSKSDFWAHWESNEVSYHAVGCPQEFNIKLIDALISFLEQINNNNKSYIITQIETKMTTYLINNGYRFSAVVPVASLKINPDYVCPIFHPDAFGQWINRNETFAIKWKYMINYIDLDAVNNPVLNYLTRYIHFGPNGIQGEPQKQRVYSSPFFYYK